MTSHRKDLNSYKTIFLNIILLFKAATRYVKIQTLFIVIKYKWTPFY